MKHVVGWLSIYRNSIILALFIVVIIVTIGRGLTPMSKGMFTFHDETQAARVQQFTVNLHNLQIPPRIAPEFSYGMGYPVFNFYAPFAYWATSLLVIVGFSVITALKVSFLLALLLGFIGMYLLLKELFDEAAGLLGGTLYVTSLFIPVEIFVRGNLSEVWFIGLFPVTLFLLLKNAEKVSRSIFFATTVCVFFLLTVHNIFSLLSLALLPIFIVLLKEKRRNIIAFTGGLLLSSYFIVPAIIESKLTYASEIAAKTYFGDHFLCVKQLWSTLLSGGWGYGGSVAGCQFDGMSFALGKSHILLGIVGAGIIVYSYAKNRTRVSNPKTRISLFVLVMTSISIFFSLNQSTVIWNLLSPIFSLFQFPWRFLVFGVFGLAFLGGRLGKGQLQVSIIICVLLLISSAPFFKGQTISSTVYESKYLSQEYIHNAVVYKIPEYLPTSAQYEIWRGFEDTNEVPYSEGLFRKNTLNIHYFPYWKVEVNGNEIIPKSFDKLGRPQVDLDSADKLTVKFQQTSVEQLGNVITLVTFIALILVTFYKPLWMKVQKIKN